MPNLKFSQFVEKTDPANVQFLVGYNGIENVRIEPSNVTDLSGYLPLTGGTLTGNLDVDATIFGRGNVEFEGGDSIFIRNKPTLNGKLVTLWEHTTDRILFGDLDGVYSGSTFNIEYKNDVAHLFKMRLGIDNSTPSYPLDVTGEGRFTGDVRANSFINTSDSSLKDNIKDIRTDLVSLKYKEYTLKDDKYGKTRYGILAEDLKDTHPEFVHYNDKGEAGVDYISLLVKKIAELEARLNDAGIK